MDRNSLFIPAILLAALLLIPAAAIAGSGPVANLMCPCGTCDEPLISCECPESDNYRSQILLMMDRGESTEQIVQDFVDRFGESVLVSNAAMAPGAAEGPLNKRVFGFVLLLAGILTATYAGARHLKRAAPAVPTRGKGRSKSSHRVQTAKEKKGKEKRFQDGVDNDILDDHDII